MSDRTFLLQDWITVRSSLTSAFVQDQEDWLDLTGFADAAFWIDVTEVTPPPGASANFVQLFLETAPTCDDFVNASALAQSWFQPTTGTIRLGAAAQFMQASATPFVVKSVRAQSTVSLSRYLRWRLLPSAAGAWDLTFRIRVVANRSGFFAPTDISGCVLWLRSDLGITLGTGQNMNTWADQSGLAGNTATAFGATLPLYNSSGGVNNLPRLTNTTGYMRGSLPYVDTHTLFTVVTYPTLDNKAAFAGTNGSFAVNSGFSQFTEIGSSGIVGRAGASSVSFASAVTTNTSSLGTGNPGIYSTAASSNGSVDILANGGGANGSGSASTPFTLFSCPNYVLLALDSTPQYALNGDAYEYILFNRVLSAAERTRVHRYLGGRYGVAVP